jgi:cardiolipin synthase
LLWAEFSFSLFSQVLFGKLFTLLRGPHHQIIVADAHVPLIGGINIANKYHGKARRTLVALIFTNR